MRALHSISSLGIRLVGFNIVKFQFPIAVPIPLKLIRLLVSVASVSRLSVHLVEFQRLNQFATRPMVYTFDQILIGEKYDLVNHQTN